MPTFAPLTRPALPCAGTLMLVEFRELGAVLLDKGWVTEERGHQGQVLALHDDTCGNDHGPHYKASLSLGLEHLLSILTGVPLCRAAFLHVVCFTLLGGLRGLHFAGTKGCKSRESGVTVLWGCTRRVSLLYIFSQQRSDQLCTFNGIIDH